MVFYGEYIVAITAGGRVALPKKIRDGLTGGSVIITKGFGSCLAGYDKRDWENRANSLLDVSLLEKEEIEKRRVLFSSTVYIDIDEQGRIVLPRGLRLFSSLSKKVVIAGVGDHFEIWSLDRWEVYIKEISSVEK